ncbi:MAG: tripartite tricarboxylate transporter substrate-binding protein [Rhizobiaceae bacterium]
MIRHLIRNGVGAAAALSLMMGAALAEWPEKPIQIIIPWPAPNDSSTLIASAMAPVMSEDLGVPVKVVNKAGGGAVLGTSELAQSRPDGYTMGLISIGPMITQVLRGKTPYKNQDLQPLGLVWSSPFTLAARADAPYNNLDELAEYGKENELRLAHWGLGAVPTLIAMKAAEIGGFEWKETAYSELNPLLVVQGGHRCRQSLCAHARQRRRRMGGRDSGAGRSPAARHETVPPERGGAAAARGNRKS